MGHLAEIGTQTAARPVPGVAVAERARIVLAIMLIAQAPDGRAAPEITARIMRVCRGAPALAGLGPQAMEELSGLTLRALAVRGPDRVLADLRGLMTRPLVETAMALATRAAFDGGRIAPETAGILGGLATHLGLPVSWLSDLFDIIGALERPFG